MSDKPTTDNEREAVFTEAERCPRCKGIGFIGKAVDVEGKPIPTTGVEEVRAIRDEWDKREPTTVEQQLADLQTCVDAVQRNRDEIHQQLAAEQEVGHNQAVTLGQHIARLEDQLAAERDAVERWQWAAECECKRKEAWFNENQQLREQLAAEREKAQAWLGVALDYDCKTPLELAQLMERAEQETEKLSQQLAAAVEIVENLTTWLTQCDDYAKTNVYFRKAEAWLAKIGEGK